MERFYQRLRHRHPAPPASDLTELAAIRTMAAFYAGLSQADRRLLLAWAKKEESGIGMIPLALSSVPLVGLIFSARLQEPLRTLPIWAIFALWSLAGLLLLSGFYIHQRQKAWTMLHIVLLEQAIQQAERAMQSGGHVLGATHCPPAADELPELCHLAHSAMPHGGPEPH